MKKLFLTLLCLVAATSAHAASFTFNGVFQRDDQGAYYQFRLNAPSAVTLRTTSYAAGGFSPVLSLFDSSQMNLLVGSDNGADNTMGDANLAVNLAAGTYQLVLTQYDNLATGPRLSDGFLRGGDPSFTSQFAGRPGQFFDVNGMQRSPSFGIVIDNVSEAAGVPEPATLAMAAVGIVGLLAMRRRMS